MFSTATSFSRTFHDTWYYPGITLTAQPLVTEFGILIPEYLSIQVFLDNTKYSRMYAPKCAFRGAREGRDTTGYGCAFYHVFYVLTIGNYIFVYG